MSTQLWWLLITRQEPRTCSCSSPSTCHWVSCTHCIHARLPSAQRAATWPIRRRLSAWVALNGSSLSSARANSGQHHSRVLSPSSRLVMTPRNGAGRCLSIAGSRTVGRQGRMILQPWPWHKIAGLGRCWRTIVALRTRPHPPVPQRVAFNPAAT
ncbi:hypothetical protein D3C81_1646020 [compost metagenome]